MQDFNSSQTKHRQQRFSGWRARLHTRSGTPARRRGMTAFLVAACMLFFLIPLMAFAVDMGFYYLEQNRMQKAADAAALAGAYKLANFQPKVNADANADYYAGLPTNGTYVNGTSRCTVTKTFPAMNTEVSPAVSMSNWYRVDISRPTPTYFAQIFGFRTMMVRASATALFETLAPMEINGLGSYGVAPGPVNVSVFGPNAFYNNGDCYSSQYLPSGAPNPLYTGLGYDFTVTVPSSITNATLEIFDPDCYNNPVGGSSGEANAEYPYRIDEYRTSTGGVGTIGNATQTQYTLYYDNNTPNNPTDDTQVGQATIGAGSVWDMKWNNIFNFNRSSYGSGNFRLNVTPLIGASENGFDLRCGPTRAAGVAFDPNNGTHITADGHLPINFNTGGEVTIALGSVPVQAAGGNLTIRKFDTDVGAKSITYSCDTLPGMSWDGTLSSNGTFATDTIAVPTTYNTAGIWRATYVASVQDTSVWDMSYANSGPGKPGSIKLIR